MAKESKNDPRVEKITKSFRYSYDSFKTAREDSERAVRFVNNETYTDAEKKSAKKHNKPTLSYNIIIPILSTLMGNEQLNRRQALYKPTTLESVQIADVVQSRWSALVDEQDIEDKLQIAFTDALSTKVGGWIQRTFEVNEAGYLDFKYDVINNMRVFIDPDTRANDYKLEHCRWIIKEGWETLDVIAEKYDVDPDDLEKERSTAWWTQLSTIVKRFTDKEYSKDLENFDKENDRYRILEMQERTVRKMSRIYDGENYLVVEKKSFNRLKRENPQLVKIQDFDQSTIHITTMIPFLSNLIVLDEDAKNPTPNFDVFPVFSYNYNVQVTEQTSLVDLLLDVQEDVNKAKSQIRDYVTQILSGGIFIDKREKETIKKLRTEGNQPNMVYELNNPANMPSKMPPGQIPPDVMLNAENSVVYAQRLSLISEAMKGETARSGESGVLFEQKVKRAAAAINPYFKNLARLRKTLAEDFVDNFGFVYAEKDRVLRIKEDDLFSEVIVNLQTAGKVLNNVINPSIYVELDEGEQNITNIEDNFNKLLALVNLIGQYNPALVDVETLVAQAPVPGAEKMVDYIKEIKQAQAQGAQAEEDIKRTKSILENLEIERGMLTDEEELRMKAGEKNGS